MTKKKSSLILFIVPLFFCFIVLKSPNPVYAKSIKDIFPDFRTRLERIFSWLKKEEPESLRQAPKDISEQPAEDLFYNHFKAKTESGDLVNLDEEMKDKMVEIVKRDGKTKIRIDNNGNNLYIDPLAIRSKAVGELGIHPSKKALETKSLFNLQIDEEFLSELNDINQRDKYFHTINASDQVISEISLEKCFLIRKKGEYLGSFGSIRHF